MMNDKFKTKLQDEGEIISLADTIAWVSGLDGLMYGELVEFSTKALGLTLNLEEDKVGVVVLSGFENLKRGDKCFSTGKLFEIGVSEEILGRVIDPTGVPLDEKGEYKKQAFIKAERVAPGIIERKPVDTPLQTGIKAIDSMIPIGRGQRELIIGDRG